MEIKLAVYRKEEGTTYFVSVAEVGGRPVLFGYNDMFTAFAIARGVSGRVYKSGSVYVLTYSIEPSLLSLGKAETVYNYFATAVVPKLIGARPWAVGAEVTILVFRSGDDYLLAGVFTLRSLARRYLFA